MGDNGLCEEMSELNILLSQHQCSPQQHKLSNPLGADNRRRATLS